MSSKERVVYAIIKFLAEEAAESTSEEAKESIEVARQCLETAYGVEYNSRADLDLGAGLEAIVSNAVPQRQRKVVTEEMKVQAEALKSEGNEHMKVDRHQEAVDAYSRAIDIDNTNAIYYSNRAAAYNKLNRYYEAVDDCDEAISLDEKYSKAYGRKGLALSGLNQHPAAIDNYKRAIELDPNNENFRTNLEIAEEKSRTAEAPVGAGGFGSLLGGGGGMPDIGALMNNPAMMQMATQMMQAPGMQQVMRNFVDGMGPGNASDTPAAANTQAQDTPEVGGPQAPAMDDLFRAGQQLAEQMQRSNPELVDQLKNQFQDGVGGDKPGPNGGGSSGT